MTLWTTAHHAPLFTEFSRQEYWSGLPVPSPGIFLVEPRSPTLQADSLPSEYQGSLKYPMCTLSLKGIADWKWPLLSALTSQETRSQSYPGEQQNTTILNHAVQSHVLKHAKWGDESCAAFPAWEKKCESNEMKITGGNEVSYPVLFSWAQKKKKSKPDHLIVGLTDWTVLSQWESVVSMLDFQWRLIPVQGPQAIGQALKPRYGVTFFLSVGIISAPSRSLEK